MLGDYYKANPKVAALVDQAINIVKWFNNHSYCLGMLRAEQLVTYKKVLALILPVLSRWTSHFCLISWLLQTNIAMTLAATRHREQFLEYVGDKLKKVKRAERVLDHVTDKDWWKELAMWGNLI